MQHVISVHNSGVTRTRITLTADEVRVKFPGSTKDADYWQKAAMQHRAHVRNAARALRDHLNVTTTLRGRMGATEDGGFHTTLVNTNGREVGRYHIAADLSVCAT